MPWLQGNGITFESPEGEEAYRERTQIIKDAVQLKTTPSRVPIAVTPGVFALQCTGRTPYDGHYSYDKLADSWKKFYTEFGPDYYRPPTYFAPGKVMEILDYRLGQWPGGGLSKNRPYQYIEKEWMKAEEYYDFIDDPTGYFINIFYPRISGLLEPLQSFPIIPTVHEFPSIGSGIRPFGQEAVQTLFTKLIEAGNEINVWGKMIRDVGETIKGKGYPVFPGGTSRAPFDFMGDCLRGTIGVMTDMYRHPDELLEACERITPLMIKHGIHSATTLDNPFVFIPLHKGSDGFMSAEQFNTFYWPTLRKLIIGLVNEGLVPVVFAEGIYTSRLDLIADQPAGKTIWWFDQTDMALAKKKLGHFVCVMGNMPVSLLVTSTPDGVSDYCKKLIDTAGVNGGFIFATGAGTDDSKPENVKAMINTTKAYGKY